MRKLPELREVLASPASVSSGEVFLSLLRFLRSEKATKERVLKLLRKEEKKANDPNRKNDFVDIL